MPGTTASIFLAINAVGDAPPEWIMVLPAGVIRTHDGRGPYTVADMTALAKHSLAEAGGKLPLDENHATDYAAPNGFASPARGWMVDLQARTDGMWARVKWTKAGAELMSEQAYRGISPVFEHDKDNRVLRVLRASLTNTPNLRGLTALHSEGVNMDLLAELRKLLGLAEEADAAAVIAKVKTLLGGSEEATQSRANLGAIAKAVNLKEDADAKAVLHAVTTLATTAKGTGGADERVTALQSELTQVTTSLNALQGQVAKERATTFVDNAIKAGRVGVKPLREHYIEQHAKDPTRVEKEISALPVVESTMRTPAAHAALASDADPVAIAAQAAAYQKKMAEQGTVIDIATAVHAVTTQKQEKTQ